MKRFFDLLFKKEKKPDQYSKIINDYKKEFQQREEGFLEIKEKVKECFGKLRGKKEELISKIKDTISEIKGKLDFVKTNYSSKEHLEEIRIILGFTLVVKFEDLDKLLGDLNNFPTKIVYYKNKAEECLKHAQKDGNFIKHLILNKRVQLRKNKKELKKRLDTFFRRYKRYIKRVNEIKQQLSESPDYFIYEELERISCDLDMMGTIINAFFPDKDYSWKKKSLEKGSFKKKFESRNSSKVVNV